MVISIHQLDNFLWITTSSHKQIQCAQCTYELSSSALNKRYYQGILAAALLICARTSYSTKNGGFGENCKMHCDQVNIKTALSDYRNVREVIVTAKKENSKMKLK